MATYYSKGRTNYFSIKPGKFEEFLDLLKHIQEQEDPVEVVTKQDGRVALLGVIDGYVEDINDEDAEISDVDIFWEKLQPLLDKDTVVIYKQVGYEKMRYLTDFVTMVTSTSRRYHESDDWIHQTAIELGVDNYSMPEY